MIQHTLGCKYAYNNQEYHACKQQSSGTDGFSSCCCQEHCLVYSTLPQALLCKWWPYKDHEHSRGNALCKLSLKQFFVNDGLTRIMSTVVAMHRVKLWRWWWTIWMVEHLGRYVGRKRASNSFHNKVWEIFVIVKFVLAYNAILMWVDTQV